jgi:hypothetical protein
LNQIFAEVSTMKTYSIDEINYRWYKNVKQSCVYGLEKLLLLKWPYNTMWSKILMESLQNTSDIFQWTRKQS